MFVVMLVITNGGGVGSDVNSDGGGVGSDVTCWWCR